MFDNLVILAIYVIAFCALLGIADLIANLVYEFYESRLQYGNAKVGHILAPKHMVKKSKFNSIIRNMLQRLRFN